MIDLGIIGGGRVSHGHARCALALPQLRLAGIAEIDPERRAQLRERYGCEVFPDPDAMLASPAVEAVVIALPHHLHAAVAVAAFEAGKHVFLEKPMAMDTGECDRILAAAQAAGRQLMVGHHRHFVPANIEARRLIAAGAIGEPVLATDTWYKGFYSDTRPPWFLDAAQGGGMWPMNGSHMIDQLCFLLDTRVASVRAQLGSRIFGHSATDTGIAFLEFERGICATIAHAGYREGVPRFESEITGTEAQLRVSGRQLWRGAQEQWEELAVPGPELDLLPGHEGLNIAFALELEEFAAAAAEGRRPAVDGEYGRHIVQALTACEESSRLGREVRLS